MANQFGISPQDEDVIRVRDTTCVYCHKAMRTAEQVKSGVGGVGDQASIEHLNFCGPFYIKDGLRPEDIVICCRSCNSSRGRRRLRDWFRSEYCVKWNINFPIEQINDLHARPGSAKTPPEYVRPLKALRAERYDCYLVDGHSEYFGQRGQRVVSPTLHEVLCVPATGQRETFLPHPGRHERRETTYLEMSGDLAESGIENCFTAVR